MRGADRTGGNVLNEHRERRRHRLRSGARRLAFGTAAAVALAGAFAGVTASNADQQTVPTGADSAAHGHGLWTELFGLSLAGTANAVSDHPDNAGANGDDLDIDLLDSLVNLNLGTVNLPLIKDPGVPGAAGLLDAGSLGLISSYAESPSATNSIASSGLLLSDGALDLQAQNASGFEPARIDLGALLDQLLTEPLADAVLRDAVIEVGALGARAEKNDGAVTSEYMVSDLDIALQSPVVVTLGDTVETTVDTVVGDVVDGAVGPTGVLGSALSGLSSIVGAVDLTVLGTGLRLDSDPAQTTVQVNGVADLANDIKTQLVTQGVSNSDDSVTVNLDTGEIAIDLAAFVIEAQNDPAITDLDQLPPNTPVLSSAVITAVANGVTEALTDAGNPNSLVSKVQTLLEDGIWDLGVEVRINAAAEACVTGICEALATGNIVIDGTLEEFAGANGESLDATNIDPQIVLLGFDVGDVLAAVTVPLLTFVTDNITGDLLDLITDDVIDGLQPALITVVGTATSTLLDPDGALGRVLAELVQLTINDQPTNRLTPVPGDLGAGSFTVRALTLEVLPQPGGGITDAVGVELGSATVLAEDPTATLTATPAEVAEGETVTLTGSFFAPDEAVAFLVNGAPDATITATTNASGGFTATWVVPAGFDLGDVTFTATDVSGNSDTATVEVVEASLTASDAEQGGTVEVRGQDFVPGETVTIDLPGGGTTTVTAQPDGSISYDWPVPETQAPGDVTFTATGASGRTASDDATISRATATLTASPNPVAAGGTVTLTGGNFAPGEPVTLTLPAVCAVTSGVPVVADGSGAFTVTCTVGAAVPDATALNFSASGNSSGRTATAQTEVDSQPAGDVNANASASAAASAQADGDNQAAVRAAAQAAAMADNSTSASADSDATASAAAQSAARASVTAGASQDASTTATSAASASAQAAAQASADSTAAADADASAAGSIVGSVDSRAASQAASDAAANGDPDASATASQDASANVRANANASASASASARANGAQEAAAQAAAQAAAYSEADSDASASADTDASAAAEAAAYADVDADASQDASSDVTTTANSAAQASALSTASAASTSTADASAVGDQNADSDAAGDDSADFDSASAARAAAQNSATADADGGPGASGQASQDAAANVRANANASASASASADADSHSNPSAQAAAQAAAYSESDNDASAAAEVDATAAAQAAARPNVQSEATADQNASADASQDAESSARAAATSTASAAAAQDADSTAAADVNAEASSAAAAQSTASANASQNAAADVNASASASASAQADSKANAAAQAAAETAAMADATTTASASVSAAATANAQAAAQAAAETAARADVRSTASQNASQNTSAQANVAATAAAQASADNSSTAQASASAQARATATANASSAAEAAARQAANADSTANASASAAATATAQAASQGSADTSGGQKLERTGAMIGGLGTAAVLLLLVGSALLAVTMRRRAAAR